MSKIVFAGDSVTKGIGYGGITTPTTFAHKVGTANGYRAADIVNAGVNSDTSSGLLARLSRDVISFAPAVAVIEIGLNDWITSVPVATYQTNISSILATLQSASIKPVGLSKMQRGSTAAFAAQMKYVRAFEDACTTQNVRIVDLFREECASYLYLTNAEFYANYVDAVHLTITGHQFVTDLCGRAMYAGCFN